MESVNEPRARRPLITNPTSADAVYAKEYTEDVLDLYAQGLSAPAIAAKLPDLPVYQVRKILKAQSVQMQGGSRSAKKQAWPLIEEHLPNASSKKELAELTGIPSMTLSRWLAEEGVEVGDVDRRARKMPEIRNLIAMRASLSEISEKVEISERTLGRWLQQEGLSTDPIQGHPARKKSVYWDDVLRLHNEGQDVETIAQQMPVHYSTVAQWLRDEGLMPRYRRTASSEKGLKASIYDDHPMRDDFLRRYLDGEAPGVLAREMKLHYPNVIQWIKDEGLEGLGGKDKRRQEKKNRAVAQYSVGASYDAIIKSVGITYYDLRLILEEAGLEAYSDEDKPNVFCPCGKKTGSPDRKYCSKSCRSEYWTPRAKDPAKQITFNCATCGKENTRRRSYGSTISGKRFCDNKCATKHTKTVRNYVIRESDMVLDSTWEMLFAGLCGYFKIECARVDRSLVTTSAEGRHYAPDFLVDDHLWVEVKGYDANGQASARQGWVDQNGPLVVVDRELLDLLRLAADGSRLVALLTNRTHTTEESQ